ncbi:MULTISPECIES: isocitrate lyase/phosphoenolpyruvate mutase family protein [unclassified Bacillus cereus group]|uniref:isocitrate lyase/PEP mutase family protein n=1 Tax=unclassified Bacillus cereus group TaxID=2750818 RepID=UPI001F599F7A|nr:MULTISPECIES: isocitrate lyase/phosphoenolpyruvate mutase family protein [unclassified Bacillus cereus group]
MNKLLNKKMVFKDYHYQPTTLILPNAWDVMSAKTYQELGYKAIGTTSAGISASAGYLDGERIPFSEMFKVVKEITKSVDIPVSADIESGFSETIEGILENVKKLISIGVAGINLEDSIKSANTKIYEIAYQQEKIEKIKDLAIIEGVQLFVNARTDIYWLNLFNDKCRFAKTIERAKAYQDAGADGIFIPGVEDEDTIKMFVKEIELPINILVGRSTPKIQQLNSLGVSRLSFGSGAYRATMSALLEITEEVIKYGEYKRMMNNSFTYEKMMRILYQ